MRLRIFIFLAIALIWVSAASGQQRGAPVNLVRRWSDRQEETLKQISLIEFNETTNRRIGGPSGEKQVRVTVHVTGRPLERQWKREMVLMEVDGKAVPQERPDIMQRHRASPPGKRAEDLLESMTLPVVWLRSMRPVRNGVADVIDGKPAWRFEMTAVDGEKNRMKEATIWLDRKQLTLVRSRITFQRGREEAPTTVVTEYTRIKGIDLPLARNSSGVFRTERRDRSYTVEMRMSSTYTEYRLER